MGIIGMGLRGRWHWRFGVLALVVLGLLIGLDSSTAAAGTVKRVACQLPFVQGGPNFFCSDLHQIFFFTDGYDPNTATIHSELLAMDEQGNVLKSIPVHAGDFAKLTSNVNPSALKVTQLNNLFTVVAPIPVLHVTADDGVTKSEAFCSNVPFVQNIQPNDAVASLSSSDVTHVEAAIPLVDPSHLVVKVDGADIFALAGIGNPASCTPTSPCSADLVNTLTNKCDGTKLPSVTISNLVVDSGRIDVYAANTVSFDVSGLGGGGHGFSVSGSPRPSALAKFVSDRCHQGTSDKSLSSGFGITITQPTDQESGLSFPVEVKGQVCSGRSIATLNINGLDVSTGSEVCHPANSADPNKCTPNSSSPDTYTLAFDQFLSQTDLAEDVFTGTTYQPTYDLGTNRLVAVASDDLGNRAFSTPVIFATGTTQNPGITLAVAPQEGAPSGDTAKDLLRSRVSDALRQVLRGRAQAAAQQTLNGATTDIENAFVIGLSPLAVQQQFTQRCKDPVNGVAVKFAQAAIDKISVTPDTTRSVAVPCVTCGFSMDYTIHVTGVSVPDPVDNITCTTAFGNDVIHVTMDLPNVIVDTHTSGSCGLGCLGPFGDACSVDIDIQVTVSGIQLTFDITKDQILHQTTPDPNATTFTVSGTTDLQTAGGFDSCGLGEIFSLAVELITFGAVDLTPDIDVSKSADFTKEIGNSQPDPIGVCDMNVQQDTVSSYNGTLSGKLSTVEITPEGLLAGLRGSFGALDVDPAKITPGAVVTQPPLPTLPAGASGPFAFVVLSTDALNQLFASLALGKGVLETSCVDSGKTLGDLFPADCETLTNSAGPTATALAQGVCHGIRRDACEALTASSGLLTAIKQGACHGTKGDNCSSIPVPSGSVANAALAFAEKQTCNATPNLNLKATEAIVVCTRQGIPPRLLPISGGGNSPVSTSLRMRSLSAALILDRAGTGAGDLTSPSCFAKDSNRAENCSLYEACLDINYNFDMSFQTCTDGKPGFLPQFTSIQLLTRQAGLVCDGSGLAGDDSDVLSQSASTDAVKTILPKKAQDAAPPLCTKGLDLSGLVNCTDPKLITIETDGQSAFRDWLGVTCTAGPPTTSQPPRNCGQ